MNFPHKITCIDKDEKQIDFLYNRIDKLDEFGRKKWVFYIVPSNLIYDDWFEFEITQIDSVTWKVTQMDRNREEVYAAKGIPEKIIDEAAKLTGATIISSTSKADYKKLERENRTEDATKFWKRLVGKKKAVHDPESDVYTFTPTGQ